MNNITKYISYALYMSFIAFYSVATETIASPHTTNVYIKTKDYGTKGYEPSTKQSVPDPNKVLYKSYYSAPEDEDRMDEYVDTKAGSIPFFFDEYPATGDWSNNETVLSFSRTTPSKGHVYFFIVELKLPGVLIPAKLHMRLTGKKPHSTLEIGLTKPGQVHPDAWYPTDGKERAIQIRTNNINPEVMYFDSFYNKSLTKSLLENPGPWQIITSKCHYLEYIIACNSTKNDVQCHISAHVRESKTCDNAKSWLEGPNTQGSPCLVRSPGYIDNAGLVTDSDGTTMTAQEWVNARLQEQKEAKKEELYNTYLKQQKIN